LQTDNNTMNADFRIGIVGAGFAGLIAALKLKEAGKNSFIIFERASEIGGTWRDNIYPGCACDVAVHLYSFAAVPNPNWNSLYAGNAEILEYMKKVACKSKIQEHIRLNADIVEATFDTEKGYWRVLDRERNETTVSILLLAMGPLNRPFIPGFEGLSEFKGVHFHTSQWDRNFEPADKRVAVIGTGASAIQVIPNIAPLVKQLTVLQRTPAWVTDRSDKKIGETSKKLYRRFPVLQRFRREFFYWIGEFFGLGFLGSKRLNKLMAWDAMRKLRKEVKDPAIRKKLTPEYTIGCKRILKSDDYYPTFNRDNVNLVTEAIERFTPAGILTKDGKEHLLEAVIFATGFLAADLDLYIKVTGVNGRNLIDEWKSTGAEAYLGTTVAGYPNLALLLGPNTGLGHNSILHMIESQMTYIIQYIECIEKEQVYVDLKKEVQQAYNKRIQKQLEKTVWSSGCKSWYMNANGKNTTLYPGLTVTFRKETSKFVPTVYKKVGVAESIV
jgi:cation diffusion facilitator CzcD-associated flavoprotein CzcO